jgi:hypothetical protein
MLPIPRRRPRPWGRVARGERTLGSNRRRRRVEPTEEWEQIELLCGWPEQRDYELIRPLVHFGAPADERSQETSAFSGRTLRRKAALFEAEVMETLFGSERARRRRLPPAMRRLVVDLEAEHPGFNPNEIARACYARFGRRPARKTVKRVLTEEPVPLRSVGRPRLFENSHVLPQLRLFAHEEAGWIKALKLSGYAPRRHRKPAALQDVLFPFLAGTGG